MLARVEFVRSATMFMTYKNDKNGEAQRKADELIADEKQRRSPIRTYLIALVLGLLFWTIVYFIWRRLFA
jgi:hypothetical protein